MIKQSNTMQNEEENAKKAQEEKRAERIELGICPDCTPSVYMLETKDGHTCPMCGINIEA